MFGRRKSGSTADKAPESQADAAAGTPTAANPETPAAPEYSAEDGPFDRSAVRDVEAFYQELGFGYLDLGALVLGIPPQAQLNAALSPDGSPEFHIVTASSRVIPRAFAAPRTGGQWREWMGNIREQLQQQGAEIHHEDGPWGRELVATQSGATFRLIGVEGPRWMLEARVVSTSEQSEQACEEAREIVGRLVVARGSEPMPAGELLTLDIPAEITDSLNQARAQLAQQAAANAQTQHAAQPQQPAHPQQAAQAPTAPPQGAAEPQAEAAPQAHPGETMSNEIRPRKRTSALDRLRQMEDE